MGQVLIRNLDDALIADYRDAAARNQRSLEAELREALRLVRPVGPKRREELLALSRRLRDMTPPTCRRHRPNSSCVRTGTDGATREPCR